MRLQSLLFTALAAVCVAASSLSEMPKCGLACMVSLAGNSSCGLTDTACLCADAPLIKNIESCVLTTCTPKESLSKSGLSLPGAVFPQAHRAEYVHAVCLAAANSPPSSSHQNITATDCGIRPRDKTVTYNVVSDVCGTVSGVVVAIRLAYKLFVSREDIGLDDVFILVTLVTGIPSSIINRYALTKYGLARDIWTLPFDHITKFGRYFYIMETLYFSQVFLLKLSILFFYLRIFPGRTVRFLLWACVAIDVSYGIAFVVAAIFQCQPISYFWTKWSGETVGTCMSINHLAWANAALSIVMDIVMLAIPLSQLRLLKLHWKKKLGVALMFCMGTFVTVISIIRLRSLVEFANSHNTTWDQWEASLWSTIEINVGIICACMPALRVILVRIFPRVFGGTSYNKSTNGGTGAGYYGSNSHKYMRSGTAPGMPATGGSAAVRSVARGGDGEAPKDTAVIMYSRSYSVNVSNAGAGDSDETALVQMEDLDRTSAAASATESFEMKAPSPTHRRLA